MAAIETWKYTAVTVDGQRKSGVVQAPDEREARATLRARGQIVASIESTKKKGEIKFLSRGPKMKVAELASLTRQIAQDLAANVQITSTLAAIAEDEPNQARAAMLRDITGQLLEGRPLAVAFGSYPKVFDAVFVSYLAAGHESGDLAASVSRLAKLLESQATIRRKVAGATAYPKIMTGAILAICLGVIMFLVPQFEKMYDQFGATLPAPTLVVVGISNNLWLVGIVVGALLFGLARLRAYYKPKPHVWWKVNKFQYRMPIFGRMWRYQALFRWSSTLSGVLAARLPIAKALDLAGRASGSAWMELITASLVEQVSSGVPLSQALAPHTALFSSRQRSMIRSADESGDLAVVLDSIATQSREDVEEQVEKMAAKIETAMLLLMAGIAGGLVIVLYLPILMFASTMFNSVGK